MANRNDWAWAEKETRKNRAERLVNVIEEKYIDKVMECVDDTYIYDLGPEKVDAEIRTIAITKKHKYETAISVQETDTVSAIFNNCNNESAVAVLNFASYKEPGGCFLKGSMAQEEALCHESILYNVLRRFQKDYYDVNCSDLNHALYRNKALYTHNVSFRRNVDGKIIEQEADVITCAAPNKYTAKNYCKLTNDDCNNAMRERIRFILTIAARKEVKTLILGAWGCGVFGNEAMDVAKMFKEELDDKFQGVFAEIVFAVMSGPNYEAFSKVFCHQVQTERGLVGVIADNYSLELAKKLGYTYAFSSKTLNRDIYMKTLDENGYFHESVLVKKNL